MQRRQSAKGEWIPSGVQWPVDPQEDVPVSEDRVWVDGCFDFTHHGHAGAMLQARQLGTELLVGVHSDESILENKGPTVMRLDERIMAVEACRWATKAIPRAPYVTSLPWITHYGCQYVVHGDDITSDSDGKDCYRYVKAAGRFKVVKRTPGISTTDLVGRMLLCTKTHFIQSLEKRLSGDEGPGGEAERLETGQAMLQRIKDYATDATGLAPGCDVWYWHASRPVKLRRTTTSNTVSSQRPGTTRQDSTASQGPVKEEKGKFHQLVQGKGVKPGQVVVYVDGGWDLFSSGHIEFLRKVTQTEEDAAKERGWYLDDAKKARIESTGEDYGPVFLVAGIHDDEVINHWKGINYPIMNIFERGLCVLQCKYIHAAIFGAPFSLSKAFLLTLPYSTPSAVYHGITQFMPLTYDPYAVAKALQIYREIDNHEFQDVNAEEIVSRIMSGRKMYEERQRKKGEKGVGEEGERVRQELEREQRRREVEGQFGI
ncbi:ethanolamine-phosphate cytidylyltransferas-like protein [Dothidotthia symphoricarpi CBS 119687]|uniref:ethanolamine-phosphate cytidylyltransferase n=1 Tax=Dothidotthia symphoricarpi CBS 119687 TaxID=1392245 RepID=A0A6A6A6G2_9PLEO|nr:ethanolamine-phosphate cytidylyltransferas-like protein [Dothidotthia symphoricarpi CBS 119687]KAF2127146.1 ethanolamine-phosphate cytidylyltransferas-like protein [Dothidotthia symphoricarpi CBS 119687]